jgi:DeoR/GlpR family transcriptional regulator of sugar metabolism
MDDRQKRIVDLLQNEGKIRVQDVITVSPGCSTPSAVDAEVKQAMVKAAGEVCILTDSSKFGHNCLVRFASLSEIDLFITDSELSPMFLNELKQNAVATRLADPILQGHSRVRKGMSNSAPDRRTGRHRLA